MAAGVWGQSRPGTRSVLVDETHPGYFRLTHFAATVRASELRRPALRCWAYQVALSDEDAPFANAHAPLHLVRDLSRYDESCVLDVKRRQLRKARASLSLVRITDPRTLREQGWHVVSDNMRRLGVPKNMTETRYLAEVDSLVGDDRGLVIGAMADDRLVGYMQSFAVDNTAYLDRIYLADEARSLNVSAVLFFDVAQLYRRSGKVAQLCSGPAMPDQTGIGEFKRRIGQPIVRVPAYFWSPRLMKALLRKVSPPAHYRATGELPAGMTSDYGDSNTP